MDLYPFVCWHIGAVQSSEKFIRKIIAEVKDNPRARWLYMGDGGECNIKESKGDVYAQTMSPGDQLETLAAMLAPIKDKGIGGLDGNHGERIYRATGMNWDETLCKRLEIPYFGISCFGQLVLRSESSGGAVAPVSIFATHGAGSGTTAGGQVNAALKPLAFVDADIVLTAHSHRCSDPDKSHRVSIKAEEKRLEWRVQHSFICGSAYDSRLGYAERVIYKPSLPAHYRIEISAKRVRQGGQRTTEVAVEGRRIDGFSRQLTNDRMLRDWEAV